MGSVENISINYIMDNVISVITTKLCVLYTDFYFKKKKKQKITNEGLEQPGLKDTNH